MASSVRSSQSLLREPSELAAKYRNSLWKVECCRNLINRYGDLRELPPGLTLSASRDDRWRDVAAVLSESDRAMCNILYGMILGTSPTAFQRSLTRSFYVQSRQLRSPNRAGRFLTKSHQAAGPTGSRRVQKLPEALKTSRLGHFMAKFYDDLAASSP